MPVLGCHRGTETIVRRTRDSRAMLAADKPGLPKPCSALRSMEDPMNRGIKAALMNRYRVSSAEDCPPKNNPAKRRPRSIRKPRDMPYQTNSMFPALRMPM